jgi:hypothetical protein
MEFSTLTHLVLTAMNWWRGNEAYFSEALMLHCYNLFTKRLMLHCRHFLKEIHRLMLHCRYFLQRFMAERFIAVTFESNFAHLWN